MEPIIRVEGLSKNYRGVPALKDVDFELRQGEIHALLGENGAGKSTLTKIIAGVVEPSSGAMFYKGSEKHFSSPHAALQAGIAMVFQETSLVPSMTVAHNLYLGTAPFFSRLRGTYIAAQQFLQSLNFPVDPNATVSTLGAAKRQMVEIARAVHHNAEVIVFDEPTASLTPEEKRHFFALLRRLQASGVSIVFISHAIEEALQIADRITVMRDGEIVATDLPGPLTETVSSRRWSVARFQSNCIADAIRTRSASRERRCFRSKTSRWATSSTTMPSRSSPGN